MPQWLGRFPDHEVADSALLAVVGAGAALVGGNLYEAERWAALARTVPDDDEIVRGGLALVRAGAARNGITRMGADAEEAGEAAMDLAEEHRQHICRWFYPCSYEMHGCLGEMYASDERFKAFYDAMRPGLAEHLRDAITANAARRPEES